MTAVPTRYVCGTTLVHHRGNGTAAVQPESTCATPHFHHRRRDVRAPGAAATVEVSPCVFLDGDPYERLTTMSKQARATEAQFLEHLILRAEAIYNFQPPLTAATASLVEAVGEGSRARAAGHRGRSVQRADRLAGLWLLAADASGSRSLRLVSPTRRYTGFSRMYRSANFVA